MHHSGSGRLESQYGLAGSVTVTQKAHMLQVTEAKHPTGGSSNASLPYWKAGGLEGPVTVAQKVQMLLPPPLELNRCMT